MKKSFAILLVAAAVCFITDAKSITLKSQLPDNALNDINIACDAMDLGMHDFAFQMLDSLDRLYPGNYRITYEAGLALFFKKDIKGALNRFLSVTDHPEAHGVLFSMIGNCYDNLILDQTY